jgi:crotonobetainyl-CoA:carnitine CoA-transferase CaiB-like acyl-CoA transferase
MLAGAICAALTRRALHGEASTVDVSLLGTAMWSMQRFIAQATMDGVRKFPRPANRVPHNVLVYNYRTSDNRFIALCMLQGDKYWARFCEVAGRPDLAADPRFADAKTRSQNMDACFTEVKALFASRTLAEWREILGRQDGQWDVVQDVGEIKDDVQAQANNLLQTIDYGDGSTIPLVAVPMLFDGEALPARRSSDLGADSDMVLAELGYDEGAIIDLKVKGVVF